VLDIICKTGANAGAAKLQKANSIFDTIVRCEKQYPESACGFTLFYKRSRNLNIVSAPDLEFNSFI
jgi:hypothetical protein